MSKDIIEVEQATEETEIDPIIFSLTGEPVKSKHMEASASAPLASADENCCPETRTSNQNLLWEHHFSRPNADSNTGTCLECGKNLACSQGNTTGLSRHLQTHHKDQWQEYTARRAGRDQARQEKRARVREIRTAEAAALKDAAVACGNPKDLIGSWQDFGRISNQSLLWDTFFKKVGNSRATCNRCNQDLANTDGNTTGMARHLQAKHIQDWQLYCQQRREKKMARAALKALSGGTEVLDDNFMF